MIGRVTSRQYRERIRALTEAAEHLESKAWDQPHLEPGEWLMAARAIRGLLPRLYRAESRARALEAAGDRGVPT